MIDLVCCSQSSQPLLHATLRVVFGSREGVTVTAKSNRFLIHCIDLQQQPLHLWIEECGDRLDRVTVRPLCHWQQNDNT
jgi:hypothetical protein